MLAQNSGSVSGLLQQYLDGVDGNFVGKTTKQTRQRLSKESLIQRNIEITVEQRELEQKIEVLLNQTHESNDDKWLQERDKLYAQDDTLARESDAIEDILYTKFGVQGGGRIFMENITIDSQHNFFFFFGLFLTQMQFFFFFFNLDQKIKNRVVDAVCICIHLHVCYVKKMKTSCVQQSANLGKTLGRELREQLDKQPPSNEQTAKEKEKKEEDGEGDDEEIDESFSDSDTESEHDTNENANTNANESKMIEQVIKTSAVTPPNNGRIENIMDVDNTFVSAACTTSMTANEEMKEQANKEETEVKIDTSNGNGEEDQKQTDEQTTTAKKNTKNKAYWLEAEKEWKKQNRNLWNNKGMLSQLDALYDQHLKETEEWMAQIETKSQQRRHDRARIGTPLSPSTTEVSCTSSFVSQQQIIDRQFCQYLGAIRFLIEDEHFVINPLFLKHLLSNASSDEIKELDNDTWMFHISVTLENFKEASETNKRYKNGFHIFYEPTQSHDSNATNGRNEKNQRVLIGKFFTDINNTMLSILLSLSQEAELLAFQCVLQIECSVLQTEETGANVEVEQSQINETENNEISPNDQANQEHEHYSENARQTSQEEGAAVMALDISTEPDVTADDNEHAQADKNNEEDIAMERPVDVEDEYWMSGVLQFHLYLSNKVFEKSFQFNKFKQVKSFEMVLDCLEKENQNEILGINEEFDVDRMILTPSSHKQKQLEFVPSALYEKILPDHKQMVAKRAGDNIYDLYLYQRKAVHWMLQREDNKYIRWIPNLLWREAQFIHVDSLHLQHPHKTKFWFQIDQGSFSLQPINALPDITGGILADQMVYMCLEEICILFFFNRHFFVLFCFGLGKTVECLALIELNKQTHWMTGEPVGLTEGVKHIYIYIYVYVYILFFLNVFHKLNCLNTHVFCLSFSQYRMFRPPKDGLFDEDDEEMKEQEINKSDPSVNAEVASWLEAFPPLECESGATLVVTPPNIVVQWRNEIRRHAPHMRVTIYIGRKSYEDLSKRQKGLKTTTRKRKRKELGEDFDVHDGDAEISRKSIRKAGQTKVSSDLLDCKADALDNNPESEKFLDGVEHGENDEMIMKDGMSFLQFKRGQVPTYKDLGRYDIVITDYRVLSEEVEFCQKPQWNFRRKKRYEVPDTPLLQIRWWRLIVDEAQMVEGALKKCTKMTERIAAMHRWAVTGTPIGNNGLDDLFGLCSFLQLNIGSNQNTWRRVIAHPYYYHDEKRLLYILKWIMYRQTKVNVEDELQIPPKREEFLELKLSPVEEEYYHNYFKEFKELFQREMQFLLPEEETSENDIVATGANTNANANTNTDVDIDLVDQRPKSEDKEESEQKYTENSAEDNSVSLMLEVLQSKPSSPKLRRNLFHHSTKRHLGKSSQRKLESLRQICCHPQVAHRALLAHTMGRHSSVRMSTHAQNAAVQRRKVQSLMRMTDVMRVMVKDAQDAMTQTEREMCRALRNFIRISVYVYTRNPLSIHPSQKH
ncbi:snf2 histone linker phd ring helicase [Reticulomyxa filosa]|uniref:Snf2 histone linker phd ring helicase n=1 Tax=Reticulomyxa filosa TaxID=46433 RepID=X6NIN7_RETFI|nr:snf2 histone linker phd ring helicase [Reticulomyxa filosa]|eukprot:ETO25768.1 snf2 histone linker phd ring helicase [Reticulomyxa filosa]